MVHKGPDEISPIFPDQIPLLQAVGIDKDRQFPFEQKSQKFKSPKRPVFTLTSFPEREV
jgi:hypothetical protein